jgi:hypothetical protein
MLRTKDFLISATLVLLGAVSCFGQQSVLTWHYDNMRTGVNPQETILTPSNVAWAHFGKLFTQPVDGHIVGQPLYLPNVSIPSLGVHNVVYAGTMHGSVYAFDADDNTGNDAYPLWKAVVLAPGATSVPIKTQGGGGITGYTEIGVNSTPVIDPATGILYVLAKDYLNNVATFRLWGLDVTSGASVFTPVPISATFKSGATIYTFDNLTQCNRPALLLNNGVLYIAFGSNGGNGAANEQGWVMAYSAVTPSSPTPQLLGAFDDEPGKCCGAIWGKGGGPSADSAGNIYVESGEGAMIPGVRLGQSVMKVTLGPGGLALTDYFTPYNWSYILSHDLDLNDAVLILPDQPGPHPYEAIAVGKEGTLYLLDRTNMGGFCSTCTTTDTQIVQELQNAVGPETGSLIYWNGIVYSTGQGVPIMAWALNNGLLSTAPAFQTSTNYAGGGQPVLSANGTTNGILWQLNGKTLIAYDAATLKKLYASSQAPNGRDLITSTPHFAQLAVVNGKVYVSTNTGLVVYGHL